MGLCTHVSTEQIAKLQFVQWNVSVEFMCLNFLASSFHIITVFGFLHFPFKKDFCVYTKALFLHIHKNVVIYTIFLSWLSYVLSEVVSVRKCPSKKYERCWTPKCQPLCSVGIHFFCFSTYLAPVWEAIIVLSKKKLNYGFHDTEGSNNSAGFKSA